jgi:hypothetical protein
MDMIGRNRSGLSSGRTAAIWGVVMTCVLCAAAPSHAQQKPSYSRLTPALKGRIPTQVPEFPFAAFPIDTRPMFDTFLWQHFIAVLWPSRPESHGEPFQPDDPKVFSTIAPAGRRTACRRSTSRSARRPRRAPSR